MAIFLSSHLTLSHSDDLIKFLIRKKSDEYDGGIVYVFEEYLDRLQEDAAAGNQECQKALYYLHLSAYLRVWDASEGPVLFDYLQDYLPESLTKGGMYGSFGLQIALSQYELFPTKIIACPHFRLLQAYLRLRLKAQEDISYYEVCLNTYYACMKIHQGKDPSPEISEQSLARLPMTPEFIYKVAREGYPVSSPLYVEIDYKRYHYDHRIRELWAYNKEVLIQHELSRMGIEPDSLNEQEEMEIWHKILKDLV